MSKISVLIISVVGVAIFFILDNSIQLGICEQSYYSCRKLTELLQHSFGVSFVVFFFSLLTYRMRDEVFFSWWKFAFWFAPFIAIMTYFLYRKGTSGGNSLTQGIFEAVVLWVLYGIFIFVSLIKIFFAWRRVKKGGEQ